jgi:hypothetical protein
MRWVGGRLKKEEECIQGFGMKTQRKRSLWKPKNKWEDNSKGADG